MNAHLKAINLENCINKFAGGDYNIVSADGIVADFKKEILSGLLELETRNLINKTKRIELFNTIKNCNDNFKKALEEDYDIDCIDVFVEKIKNFSVEKNAEFN